jgi:phosphatidylglycerophosphate synthase
MVKLRSQVKARGKSPSRAKKSTPNVARGESLLEEPEQEHHLAVFLFFPQFIGYVRMVALLAGFYFIHKRPEVFVLCYCLSFGLDVLDGPVARAFGQASRFGAALDMLTDKMSTPALLIELAVLYPTFRDALRVCLLLDIISHYFLLQNTLLSGRTSHKNIKSDQNYILRMFYGVKPFFAWTCLGLLCRIILQSRFCVAVASLVQLNLFF